MGSAIHESDIAGDGVATVLAESEPRKPEPTSPDAALRVAIKAAVDAGDLARASALLEVLRATPKPAPVVDIATRRKP